MQEIHYNKLPSSRYFTTSDLKQLLPFHQTTAIENLRIIFNNFALSKYPKNIVLLPDENLALGEQASINYYSYLKAVWCEDFDRQPEHLKNSLALASNLLNYIGSIDEDSPIQDHQHQSDGYVARIEAFCIINGERIQNRHKKYHQLKQQKTSIGFKFQKLNNKIYMLIGVNIKTRQCLTLSCAILRQWNMNRLKVNHSSKGIDIDLIHRICEHLFCLSRGFIREAADDYNTFHANVLTFIQAVNTIKLDNQQKICDKYKQLKLNSSNLPQEAAVLKCEIILAKQVTQQNIWELVSEVVMEWLLQTPINTSCSYASYVDDHGNDKLTLILASHYQSSNKNRFGSLENFLKGTSAVQVLLFDQVYKKEEPDPNNPVKASIMMMNKYQGSSSQKTADKTQFTLKRQQTPPELSNNPLNQSFVSQVSSSQSLSQSQTQNRKSNMKNIAKLENQIYEILKLLDSKKKILSPSQIENTIRSYIKWINKTQSYIGVDQNQYQALVTLRVMNQDLTDEQIYLLIKNNMNQFNLTVPYLMEKGKYSRIISVGKMIALDHLELLYKQSLKNRLIISKHNILPYYLKKIVQLYVNPPISAQPLKVQQISVPQLVQIIEKKNYNSHFYSSVLTVIFPQLFPQFQPVIKVLSPLLSFFIQHLTRFDHHNELVMSFIGDLLYEVCYFTNEVKINLLTNAAYMEDRYSKTLTIKQKKILEMLREGGMKGFGFQVKSQIYPIIEANKNYTQSEQIIYHITRIQKPSQLHHFYKLFSSCHYTATINKIAKYLEFKNQYSVALSKSTPLVCYFLCNAKFSNDFKIPIGQEPSEMPVDESQFHSIAERILRSESGIFQDMVRLNPNLKIAGIELKSAMKNLSNSQITKRTAQQKKKGAIDQEQIIKTYITPTTNQDYQYVQLALSSKERYLNYHTLSQMEKSYFRDCATTAVDHKEDIMRYVAMSQKMKIIQNQIK